LQLQVCIASNTATSPQDCGTLHIRFPKFISA